MALRSMLPLSLMALLLLSLGTLGGCPFLPPPADGGNGDVDDGDTDDGTDDGDNGDDGDGDDGDGATEKTLHEKIFTEILTEGYVGTESCLACHSDHASDLLETGHWTWENLAVNIDGFEDEVHGKMDLINNFCIAVPSNEGRCSQCHPSYGWKANTAASFFENTANIDCLICHDTTGTYRKHPSATGGGGDASLVVDGEVTPVDATQLQEVAYNVGAPTRNNCGLCHYYAGGGDNVKHGDLSSDLNNPTRDADVHMGGLNFTCQTCHTEMDHGIAGMALHSVDEGAESPDCTRCHGETNVHTTGGIASLLNVHLDRVACQTCHIPTFARTIATKTEWYWSEAGEDRTDIPTQEGRATYDKKKGSFVWQTNVAPVYRWYDGKWSRKIINANDTYTEAGTAADPIVIAAPTATSATEGAKVYPFKQMIGDQPVDTVNKRLIVPHLFGKFEDDPNLDNPFWGGYEWGPALEDGAAYNNQTYSGTFDFANTVMLLTVNHEIAPASEALGHDCFDCHGVASFWEQLGVSDPLGS